MSEPKLTLLLGISSAGTTTRTFNLSWRQRPSHPSIRQQNFENRNISYFPQHYSQLYSTFASLGRQFALCLFTSNRHNCNTVSLRFTSAPISSTTSRLGFSRHTAGNSPLNTTGGPRNTLGHILNGTEHHTYTHTPKTRHTPCSRGLHCSYFSFSHHEGFIPSGNFLG